MDQIGVFTKEEKLSHKNLLDYIDYDKTTGIFSSKKNWGKWIRGEPRGYTSNSGYTFITIGRYRYLAHRLAWFYIHKEWPKGDIDHIDGNRSNNSIDNLRDVSRSENNFNQRNASKNNKSGLLGVSFHKHSGLYRATIYIKYKQTCIGYYKTPEEAHQAYLETKRKIHNTCTI